MMSSSSRRTVSVVIMALSAFCMLPPAALPGGRTPENPGPPEKHRAVAKLPAGYRAPAPVTARFRGEDITVDLYAARFAQGMTVYAEIYPNTPGPETAVEIKRFSFDGREVAVSKRRWGYRALFGIPPETTAGKKTISIVHDAGGRERAEDFLLQVSAIDFPFSRQPLDLGRFSDVDYTPTPGEIAFINACAEKKKKALGRSGADLLGESVSHPRNKHFVTSSFWSKRLVMQYRIKNGKKVLLKNKLNIHRGVDLRGSTGDPVFAMADGEVVIAERMYYEGNFVVIDHGNRIFSYYMHLDELKVKEGETVRAGTLIGKVGTTGQSTAAHLHVSFVLHEVSVDPLSLLVLPLRN